jgi:hypothetical protein
MNAYAIKGLASLLLLASSLAFGPSSVAGLATASTRMPVTAPPLTANSYTAVTRHAEPPQHCITGTSHAVQCFDTEAEALRVASGGRIQLAPGQSARSLPYDAVFSTAADPSSVQAILYENANYGGATLTIYNSGCYIWNNMPAGWNDVTSSVWSGPCGISLYDYPNKDTTGKWISIRPPGTAYVGPDMNDRASSWSIP